MEAANQQSPEKGNLSLLNRIYGSLVGRSPTKLPQVEEAVAQGHESKTMEDRPTASESLEAAAQVPSSSELGAITAVEKSSKRPLPRDEYDPDNVNAESVRAKGPLKRLRRGKVAKEPIVQARTSKGRVASSRKAKGSGTSKVNRQGPASITAATSNMESDESQRTTQKKRGAGRLKSKRVGADAGLQDTGTNTDPYEVLTEILLNPSPVESPHDPYREGTSRSRAKPVKHPEVLQNEVEEQISEREANDGAEAVPEAKNRQGDEELMEKDDVEELSDEAIQDAVIHLNAAGAKINLQDLDAMLQIVNHVGCAKDNGRWQKDEANTKENRGKLLTNEGERVYRRIKALATSYNSFHDAKNANEAIYQEAKEKHLGIITSLDKEISNLIKTLLEDSKAKNQISCLYDVYYNIIPGLLGVVVDCANAASKEDIEDEELQELENLVRMSSNLAASASEQKHQPKSKSYQTARPTEQIAPKLRQLHRKLNKELIGREKLASEERRVAGRKGKLKEREEWMAENQRIRLVEEERDRLQREMAQEEILKKQRETFNKKLQDPVFRTLYYKELERIENLKARREASINPRRDPSLDPRRTLEPDEDDTSDNPFTDDPLPSTPQNRSRAISSSRRTIEANASRQATRPHPRSTNSQDNDDEVDQDEEDEDDNGLDEEDDEERLHVFGSNNLNNPNQTKPFSKIEVEKFINIMKWEFGNQEKHQVAAEALERSLDDIFILAKDFQESMNASHEKGDFVDDGWTYDVWMAPNSDPS